MKHTPGPWEAQRDPNAIMADDWCIGAQGQIDMVAVCSERDARLIAAAPDLLEALQKFVAWSEAENNPKDTTFWERVEMLKDLDAAASAALAKATKE